MGSDHRPRSGNICLGFVLRRPWISSEEVSFTRVEAQTSLADDGFGQPEYLRRRGRPWPRIGLENLPQEGGVYREKPIWEPAHYLLKMESHGLCVREISLKPPLNNLGVNLGVLVATMLYADSKIEIWWR